jgi:hypothetical protein
MKPLHRLARRSPAPVITILAAELERQGWLRAESQLAGGLRPRDIARRWLRDEPKIEGEALSVWLAAKELGLRPLPAYPTRTRLPRPSPAGIALLFEATRFGLRAGSEALFSERLLMLEAEVERAYRLGVLSGADADEWGDRAYLLLGWLARSTGETEQVREVLEAFDEPLPVERSLTTQARVRHLQAMAAADRGEIQEARRLLRRAYYLQPKSLLLYEVELLVDASEGLAASGRRAFAAERLAEAVALGSLIWPPHVTGRVGSRAVELLAMASQLSKAVLLADFLENFVGAEDRLELLVARSEVGLRAGESHAVRELFETLRAAQPRGSEVSLGAALGLARRAAAQGLDTEARSWGRALREDLEALPPEHPRRLGLGAVLEALESTEDLAAGLADAHAWWRASRSAPALAFRRPFPGAVRVRVPLERLEDEEVPDFGNPRPAPTTVH